MLAKENLDEEKLVKLVGDSMENGKALYPSNLGKDLSDDMRSKLTLLLVRFILNLIFSTKYFPIFCQFQASKYMTEFDATHCTPLPVEKFVLPWDPVEKEAFVKV